MGTIRATDHTTMQSAVSFGALVALQFPPFNLAASQTSATIQERIFLPTAFKIVRVVAGFGASPAVAGTCAINIVAGSVAPNGTLPTPDTDYTGQPNYPSPYATDGQQLFLADQPLTMSSATTVLTPADSVATGAYPAGTPGFAWDALWGPGGAKLTLRTVTNGTAAGRLYVTLLGIFYDTTYTKPVLSGFNAATDIP